MSNHFCDLNSSCAFFTGQMTKKNVVFWEAAYHCIRIYKSSLYNRIHIVYDVLTGGCKWYNTHRKCQHFNDLNVSKTFRKFFSAFPLLHLVIIGHEHKLVSNLTGNNATKIFFNGFLTEARLFLIRVQYSFSFLFFFYRKKTMQFGILFISCEM